jgi:hypothetical protein
MIKGPNRPTYSVRSARPSSTAKKYLAIHAAELVVEPTFQSFDDIALSVGEENDHLSPRHTAVLQRRDALGNVHLKLFDQKMAFRAL